MRNSQSITEEEKQEKYQTYLTTRLSEDIRTFCGENITIEPIINNEKEVTGITLVLNDSGKLEEDTELQIINFISTAYGLKPDNVNFTYQ